MNCLCPSDVLMFFWSRAVLVISMPLLFPPNFSAFGHSSRPFVSFFSRCRVDYLLFFRLHGAGAFRRRRSRLKDDIRIFPFFCVAFLVLVLILADTTFVFALLSSREGGRERENERGGGGRAGLACPEAGGLSFSPDVLLLLTLLVLCGGFGLFGIVHSAWAMVMVDIASR